MTAPKPAKVTPLKQRCEDCGKKKQCDTCPGCGKVVCTLCAEREGAFCRCFND